MTKIITRDELWSESDLKREAATIVEDYLIDNDMEEAYDKEAITYVVNHLRVEDSEGNKTLVQSYNDQGDFDTWTDWVEEQIDDILEERSEDESEAEEE